MTADEVMDSIRDYPLLWVDLEEALMEAQVSKGEAAADEGRAISGTLTATEAGEVIRQHAVRCIVTTDDTEWDDVGALFLEAITEGRPA